KILVMAGLDPATQCARLRARKTLRVSFRSWRVLFSRAAARRWVAGSSPAMTKLGLVVIQRLFCHFGDLGVVGFAGCEERDLFDVNELPRHCELGYAVAFGPCDERVAIGGRSFADKDDLFASLLVGQRDGGVGIVWP